MATRKTIRVRLSAEENLRAGAMERVFQSQLQSQRAGHSDGEPAGSAAPAQAQENDDSPQQLRDKNLVAEHGDHVHSAGHRRGSELINPGANREIVAGSFTITHIRGDTLEVKKL